MPMSPKAKRRAKRYMRRELLAITRCRMCVSMTWTLRRRLLRRGFGPRQLRGKSRAEMWRLLYGE